MSHLGKQNETKSAAVAFRRRLIPSATSLLVCVSSIYLNRVFVEQLCAGLDHTGLNMGRGENKGEKYPNTNFLISKIILAVADFFFKSKKNSSELLFLQSRPILSQTNFFPIENYIKKDFFSINKS